MSLGSLLSRGFGGATAARLAALLGQEDSVEVVRLLSRGVPPRIAALISSGALSSSEAQDTLVRYLNHRFDPTTSRAIVDALIGGGASYHADAVHFGIGIDLKAPAPLPGVVDGSTGVLSTWRKASAQQDVLIDIGGSGNFYIEQSAADVVDVFFSDGVANSWFGQFAATISNGAWHNILVSWNMDFAAGNKIVQFYFDDVAISVSGLDDIGAAFSVDYTESGWEFSAAAAMYDASDTVIYLDQFIDFSVEANRRKFITADLKPSNPSGFPSGAAMSFRGDSISYATNLGTAGDVFAVGGGSLTNASTSPSD